MPSIHKDKGHTQAPTAPKVAAGNDTTNTSWPGAVKPLYQMAGRFPGLWIYTQDGLPNISIAVSDCAKSALPCIPQSQ